MTLTKIDDRGLKTPIDLLDNEKIRLGTDVDLQLYSDNTNAVITAAGSGDLQLTSTNDDVIIQAADNIFINPQGGENGIKVYGDGGVKLYYDGSTDPKFETISTGVKATGNVGIGTTPAVSLDIHNTDSSTWNASSNLPTMIRAYNISPTTGASAGIQLRTDKSGGVAAIQYIHAVNNSTNYSSDLVFSRRIATTGAYGEQLRITNAGNLQVQSGRGVEFHNYGTGTDISSNTLDDYEEGTFDPAVLGFSNVEKQSTEWTGFYTKVGNLVFVEFYLKFTTSGTTTSTGGHIGIDNLPFDIGNTNRKRGFGGTNYQNINSSSHTADSWSLYGSQGSDFANFYVGSASVTAPSGTTQAARYIIGGFTYTTA